MRRSAFFVAALLVIGCAVGADETGEFAEGAGPGGAAAGGTGIGSSSPVTSTTGATGGMGGDMGSGGAGGANNCNFDHTLTCATAEALPSVAGDDNDPVVTRFGVASNWYKIRITEDVGSINGEDLSYTVTLTSAAGMDYDLIVHQGPEDGPVDCNATPKLGVDQGNGVETVSDSWHDDQGIGGEDDDVWLSIEVRYVSGNDCTAAGEYTLDIEGHT